MRRKEALIAVVGGIVGAILTMVVGSFSPLGAQSRSDGKFNTITCTELNVVDAEGNSRVWLTSSSDNGLVYIEGKSGSRIRLAAYESAGGQVSIRGTEGEEVSLLTTIGGSAEVAVYDRAGEGVILSTVGEHGGYVSVFGKDGEGAARMRITENGGAVSVHGKDGVGSAQMTINEYGGRVSVRGKGNDETRATIAVNEYGNGAVSTWDKNGYRLATLK